MSNGLGSSPEEQAASVVAAAPSEPKRQYESPRSVIPISVLLPVPRQGGLRAFEIVTESIKRAIRSGGARPGDALPAERRVAEALGVSRASVREGFRVLEALGVVRITSGQGPSGGVHIQHGPGDQLAEIFELWSALEHIDIAETVAFREAIEGWACRSISTGSSERVEALERMGEICDEMARTPDRKAYLDLDADFHYELVRSSDNRLAALVATAVRYSIRGHMETAAASVADWDKARDALTEEHRTIHGALHRGEGDLAGDLVVRHVRAFYHSYIS